MKKYILFSMLLNILMLSAQDRMFTYAYQSNVLSKGQKEMEVWTTMANGRENFYRSFDHKLEYEVGLGSKLQTSFYLNYGYAKGIESNNNIQTIANENSYSFANEWKLKLSDPVIDPIGTALYFEYKLSTNEVELESKLIFDKQIGRTLQAFNIVGEYAFIDALESNGNLVTVNKQKEINLEFNYAFAYKLNNNLSFGLELMNQNRHEDNVWKYSVFSAGPCLSYNFEGFWVNLSCLPQVTDFKTGKQELLQNEKIQTRLVFSYAF